MITGFEKYTADLTEYEKETLLPAIAAGIKLRIGKDRVITNGQMLKGLRDNGYKSSEPRIRKVLHVLRVSGMVRGIVRSGNGYYIAKYADDYTIYLNSLKERIQHIEALRAALEKQYKEHFMPTQTNLF